MNKKRNVTAAIKLKVLKRDYFKCLNCGNSPAFDNSVILEIDHIIPFSEGGKDDISNLQTLCEDCNFHKRTRRINIFSRNLALKLIEKRKQDKFPILQGYSTCCDKQLYKITIIIYEMNEGIDF